MVRAKFKVVSVEPAGEGVDTIKLKPVVDGSDENKRFFNATPWGEITLGCANVKATGQFQVGKEYYVDFSPAK